MAAPIPLTKSASIQQMLDPLFDAECTVDEFEPFAVRRIRKAIDDLAAEDRKEADIHLSSLLTILCDYEGARAAAANLSANKFPVEHLMAMVKVEANFLYGGSAHHFLSEVVEEGSGSRFVGFFEMACAVGAFRLMCRAVDKANADNLVMKTPSSLIPLARKAAPVLEHFGISDADVAACVDEAGALLRERRLLWLGARPDVLVADLESDDPGVAIEYSIAVTPAEAAALNDRLADALIEKDLFKPGFSLGFTGVRG